MAAALAIAALLCSAVGAAALRPPPVEAPAAALALTADEAGLVALINSSRTSAGLRPVEVAPALVAAARQHSVEMAQEDYFSHASPHPGLETPLARVRRMMPGAADLPRGVGECLYWCSLPGVRRGHRSLMNSPDHRGIIMDPGFNRVGVGVYRGPRGDFWVTELFMWLQDAPAQEESWYPPNILFTIGGEDDVKPARLGLAWLPFAFLSVAAAAPEQPAPEPVTLRYTLAPESVLTYVVKISGQGAIEALGETQPIKVSGGATLAQRTTGVGEGGTISLETTAKPVAITWSVGDNEEVTRALPTVTETMSPRGRTLKSSGYESPDPGLSALGSWGVRRLLSEARPPEFPEGPVTVGDSWGGSETIEIAGTKIEVKRTSKLTAMKSLRGHACAVIESAVELPLDIVTPPNPLGMVATIKGTETIHDTTYFDFAQGLIVGQGGTADFAFTIETKVPAPDATHVIPATTKLQLKIDRQLKE